jgi:hypothetical protein
MPVGEVVRFFENHFVLGVKLRFMLEDHLAILQPNRRRRKRRRLAWNAN